MKKILTVATCVLALTAASASAVVFTETFDAGWSTSGSWSLEGVVTPSVEMTEFGASDARLQANTSGSGGLWYENGVSGDGSQFNSGDNEQVYIDYHMSVPNGTYTFNVNLDAQMNWSNVAQPWGMGYAMYIGDAAEMAYGTHLAHAAPTGPWTSISHDVVPALDTALTGTQWNTADIPNGEWKNWNFAALGGYPDVSTVDVTSGEVVFRMTYVLKDVAQTSPDFRAFAMDNLTITLTPEPTSLSLLALAGLAIMRRRR